MIKLRNPDPLCMIGDSIAHVGRELRFNDTDSDPPVTVEDVHPSPGI